MLPRVVRVAVALTSTAVVIPYAVAFITELLYGKSSKSYNRYVRALHPCRVFALNLALLSSLTKIKYAKLFIKWTKHYRSLTIDRVVKDINFNQNNTLDIYKPLSLRGTLADYRLKPVVVFIYGGTWGSGDKNMYSLLCSHIADNFNCLVVCPNYSTYPKGFVDDMVQDVSDALQWVRSNVALYGGDKSKIALVGHSAGGHLAALTVLELCLKCLNASPDLFEHFESHHKADEKLPLQVSFLTESTFVREIGSKKAIGVAPCNIEIQAATKNEEKNISDWTKIEESNVVEGKEQDITKEDNNGSESFVLIQPDENGKSVGCDVGTSKKEAEDVQPDDVLHSVESIEPSPEHARGDRDFDMLRSIKLVIGLAGVYDIRKHFEHETERAIEHYSTMARAMYNDENNFDNFSPTLILENIPSHVKLPPFHLLHGSIDSTVPPSSSLSFAESLWKRDQCSVRMSLLVDCNHIDICLDLMDRERRWYGAVMNEIKKAFQEHLF